MSTNSKSLSQKLDDYCGQRTLIERYLAVVVVAAFLLIIILLWAVIYNKSLINPDCNKQICVKESVKILQQINPDADPCDDFYAFVCRNHQKLEKKLTEDEREETEDLYEAVDPSDGPFLRQAKDFYKICKNETRVGYEGLRRMEEVLRTAGGWPVLDGDDWKGGFDWINATHTLKGLGYPFRAFFNFSIAERNNTKSLKISTPHVWSTRPYVSVNLKKYLSDVAELFGVDLQRAEAAAGDVFTFWNNLQGEIRDSETNTVADLQVKCGALDWKNFLQKIVGPNFEVAEDTLVTANVEDLEDALRIISDASEVVQANYLMWTVVEEMAPFLTKKIQRLQNSVLQKAPESRPQFCIRFISERFDPDPMEVIQNQFLTQTTKSNLREMIENVKNAFVKSINRNRWMSEPYKNSILQKLSSLKIQIGLEKGDEATEAYEDAPGATFLELVEKINRKHFFKKMGLESERAKDSPSYDPEKNLLYVPMAALRNNYYDPQRPNYLNYGHLGPVISSELNKMLNASNFEEVELRKAIKERLKCFEGQGFVLNNSSEVAYRSLLGINAFKIARSAYESWTKDYTKEKGLIGSSYTPNQLFWISGARLFCEPKDVGPEFYSVAAQITIRNSPKFSKDFRCFLSKGDLENVCRF